MLPREATWCFTVYGVKENEESMDLDADKKEKNKKKLKHIERTKSMRAKDNGNNGMDFISVGSEFRLFNKRSSGGKSKIRSPTSLHSPTSPNSPYTPRGAQLKTKSKS